MDTGKGGMALGRGVSKKDRRKRRLGGREGRETRLGVQGEG